MSPIVVAGAGLAGALAAVYLARKGFPVVVHERRPDMRRHAGSAGRSINLALSTRGITALREVGLADTVLEHAIPMRGRMMHGVDGSLTFQPYGRTGEAIHSVSRRLLNEILLDAAEAAGAELHFESRVRDVDLRTGAVTLEDPNTGERTSAPSTLVIGADGAFSQVRQRMRRRGRFDFAQTWLEHGYKELTMPPAPDGGFRMDSNALHIWPRHEFMLIALPNPDRTFTCTLFLRHDGEGASFGGLTARDAIVTFFEQHFPDAVPNLPDVASEFLANPTGDLVTIRCAPYNHGDRAVLIGDAAHAVVPFYGQGMNAAFEDCRLLAAEIDRRDRLADAIAAFAARRKPDADAISELALRNFVVMRDSVTDDAFLRRKALEHVLEQYFGDGWRSLYGMVSFTNVPYAEARDLAARQTAWLDDAEARGGADIAGLLALAWVRALFHG